MISKYVDIYPQWTSELRKGHADFSRMCSTSVYFYLRESRVNFVSNYVNQINAVIITLFLFVSVDVSDDEETSKNRGPSFHQTEGKFAIDYKNVILFCHFCVRSLPKKINLSILKLNISQNNFVCAEH